MEGISKKKHTRSARLVLILPLGTGGWVPVSLLVHTSHNLYLLCRPAEWSIQLVRCHRPREGEEQSASLQCPSRMLARASLELAPLGKRFQFLASRGAPVAAGALEKMHKTPQRATAQSSNDVGCYCPPCSVSKEKKKNYRPTGRRNDKRLEALWRGGPGSQLYLLLHPTMGSHPIANPSRSCKSRYILTSCTPFILQRRAGGRI